MSEAGGRSLAFHPDFGVSGRPGYRKMYLSFSRPSGSTPVGLPVVFDSPGGTNHWTVLSERSLEADGSVNLSSYRESRHGNLGVGPSQSP